MRIGFLGMASMLSVRVLERLVASGHDIRFVMRPVGGTAGRTTTRLARVREDPTSKSTFRYDPFDIASAVGVPCFEVGCANDTAPMAMVADAEVDIIVVAFFNQLLAPEFLALAAHGALNVHPSPLPALRGPSPLFWTYRNHARSTAVTVHAVDPGEDSGGIYAQAPVQISFGEPLEALMLRMSDIAAAEVSRVLNDMVRRGLKPRAQRGAPGFRARRPNARDLIVRPNMPVDEVFHWVRGVGRAFDIRAQDGPERRLLDAVAIHPGRVVPGDYVESAETVVLPFDGGTVTFRAAPAAEQNGAPESMPNA